MITYNYICHKCKQEEEIRHSICETPIYKCSNCGNKMIRQIGQGSYIIAQGLKGTLEDHREYEHRKKVKDPERAIRSRKREFGRDAVGDPSMTTDPRHIVKRGRTICGQQKEVKKDEFIKAAAKDDLIVDQCLKLQK